MVTPNSSGLDTLEINSGTDPGFCVIWLHGLGASGHDFEPIVPELGLPAQPAVRFIFPHAPVRNITINNGMAMRGWYDIVSLDFDQRGQDSDGINASAKAVRQLISDQQLLGIPPEKVVLAGFSQGGAIALYTALTHTEKLAGVLALSTYLPLQDTLCNLPSHVNQLPIMMAHGLYDDVIAVRHAEQSRDFLTGLGLAVDWHTYPMAHAVNNEEIIQIAGWLKSLVDVQTGGE